jgi:hypothetical protein
LYDMRGVLNQIPLPFWLVGLSFISFFLIFQTYTYQKYQSGRNDFPSNSPHWEFQLERDGRNHGLSDDQCDQAFPELYSEIDRASAWHRKDKPHGITEDDIALDPEKPQLRLLIYEGQVSPEDRLVGL